MKKLHKKENSSCSKKTNIKRGEIENKKVIGIGL